MGNTYGENLKLSIFGTSHGPSIGMTMEGIYPGLPIDFEKLQAFLNRRAPGQNDWSTPRKEADIPEFTGGITDGATNGDTICAVIYNKNTRSGDYDELKHCPRPGHADYTARVKYGDDYDLSGGGHFSGRLTAPLCIAGGLCKQWLEAMGIRIGAHIAAISSVCDKNFDPLDPQFDMVDTAFPTLDRAAAEKMQLAIAEAKSRGDSIGGSIECAVTGVPAGLGEHMFSGVENRICQIIFGIPAVKGISFGDTATYGSENNDPFAFENGQVKTLTNHCGGILGGITNGMPIVFRAAFKPTPSIAQPQQTVNLQTGENVTIQVKGRHDPCIVPRAVPVVEAAAAIAVYDMLLERRN